MSGAPQPRECKRRPGKRSKVPLLGSVRAGGSGTAIGISFSVHAFGALRCRVQGQAQAATAISDSKGGCPPPLPAAPTTLGINTTAEPCQQVPPMPLPSWEESNLPPLPMPRACNQAPPLTPTSLGTPIATTSQRVCMGHVPTYPLSRG